MRRRCVGPCDKIVSNSLDESSHPSSPHPRGPTDTSCWSSFYYRHRNQLTALTAMQRAPATRFLLYMLYRDAQTEEAITRPSCAHTAIPIEAPTHRAASKQRGERNCPPDGVSSRHSCPPSPVRTIHCQSSSGCLTTSSSCVRLGFAVPSRPCDWAMHHADTPLPTLDPRTTGAYLPQGGTHACFSIATFRALAMLFARSTRNPHRDNVGPLPYHGLAIDRLCTAPIIIPCHLIRGNGCHLAPSCDSWPAFRAP
ncbi:hypothetical protein LX32DRAFT_338565 [Colletotrichum zoysiae]|uniref:Uncharacterized protein n=1 Tax=Colletotrichum zoysiae TaxID=1216348 RepID=A0AAD9M240_9PEZI|nr:hypothetical protein LX32DRAFT_338565 [Colletotrichum zoysiae]